MREVTVHNWDELQKVIFEDVWDESIMRYRSNSVYRGMGSAHWGLLSSLNRVCAHDLSLEKQMLRSLKKYGYADLDQSASFWQFLVIGQQFGLPTRLLDWTYSPLVAAHFATEDQKLYDRDGVIYKADVNRINTHLPSSLQEMLRGNRANIFSMDELEQLGESFDSLKRLENAGQPFALFFEPASMVDRIANQYALFSVTSSVQTALDTLPYNTDFTDITWENSSLRAWLNGDFMNAAFSDKEKSAILTAEVDNSPAQGNSEYEAVESNNTQDTVFLLSYAEAWQYFTKDASRICTPTAYAVSRGAWISPDDAKTCAWWLRSPGSNGSCAMRVSGDGTGRSAFVDYKDPAVRPVIRIDLNSDSF